MKFLALALGLLLMIVSTRTNVDYLGDFPASLARGTRNADTFFFLGLIMFVIGLLMLFPGHTHSSKDVVKDVKRELERLRQGRD
jgi:hypothetical protein